MSKYISGIKNQFVVISPTGSVSNTSTEVQKFPDGSATNPSITFTNDTNTGIFATGADILGFATNGTERLRIDGSGNVGIGTIDPQYKLSVVNTNNTVTFYSGGENQVTSLLLGTPHLGENTGAMKVGLIAEGISAYSKAKLHFCLDNTDDNGSTFNASVSNSRMTILPSGNIGIATSSPSYTLGVNGTIGNNTSENYGTVSLLPASNPNCGYIEWRINNGSTRLAYMGFGGQNINLVFEQNGGFYTSSNLGGTGYIYNGRMGLSNGVIQRGGSEITSVSDLGLYSRTSGNWIRYVTNNADHAWFNTEGGGGEGGQEAMRLIQNWGGNGTTLRVVGAIMIATTGASYDGLYGWRIFTSYDGNMENLIFSTNDTRGWFARGYLEDDDNVNYRINDFTGSHRCKYSIQDPDQKIGLIVISTGNYSTVVQTEEGIEVKNGKDAITIFDSLPIVELCSIQNDKRCLGVIASLEDINQEYRGTGIAFKAAYIMPEEDQRLEINSVGEGAIWVSNFNGNIDNGDYITSCAIPGYGMKQNDDILHNYTVAKITCNVDFSNLTILEENYQVRYMEADGTIITKEEYLLDNQNRYIGAFVGCTYHCG